MKLIQTEINFPMEFFLDKTLKILAIVRFDLNWIVWSSAFQSGR